ncbi:hypothetical protein [Nocardioides xinjiangensis]|uniref:hypothetical protein n=1 Tax=Nocardioides xinjiangensis TaxID=2817376 RepID=UPI001B304E8B|nr:MULTISPECIES: hypothetical protein [unclassified Nocardioides]
MPPSVRNGSVASQSGLPRRTVVRAGAWTVPVVTVATAAPSFAASPCATDYSYLLDWGSSTSSFSRGIGGTAAAATATTTSGAGGQSVRVEFASALIGTVANGYTLDPTYNLSVPGPSGGGTAPNVTNLGNLTPGGAERGLCLQHSTSTTASVNATTGNPDRGQRLTISFPRAVSNLSFWLVDIDSTSTGYWDRVRFTTVAPTPSEPSPNINGTGFGTSPFRYGTAQSNSNIDENSAGARVRVSFGGPVSTLVLEYWNAAYSSGSSIQRLFLSDLSFTAKGC